MYLHLIKIRDMECVKMNQASNALLEIRMKKDRQWREELLAERILLECDLKNKLIVEKIRELKCEEWYTPIYKKRRPHKGSLTISNIEFELKSQDKPKISKYTDFYVIAVSHGTNLQMSKAVTVNDDNRLVFDNKFVVEELGDNFTINVEVFTIRMRTQKEGLCKTLFRKNRPRTCCKIYYEDVNLNELLESDIIKHSFTPCANFTVTKSQIGNDQLFISSPTESRFKNSVGINIHVNQLDLGTDLSGFLTLGTRKNLSFTWDRKWCSLKGDVLSIYDYPQDETLERDPRHTLRLEYCLLPLVKEVNDCPRRRTFVLKTGRPGVLQGGREIKLRKRQHFVLEKFYLSADNAEDFKKWTGNLESSLETMKDWKRLVFEDDYYVHQ